MQVVRARNHHHDVHHRNSAFRWGAHRESDSARMGCSHNGRDALPRWSICLPFDESRHALMKKKKVVIIGGGLAGLSAGYHLLEQEPMLFEKESVVGGLCRSFTQDGFTFDCTGHLIHLKNPYTKDLVTKLLPDAFNAHERLAAIHSKSVTTPYPFQANTYGLPPEVVKECVVGFVESMHASPNGGPKNFHDWVLKTFGTGIAKHFMLPYNEKFWKQDLRTITSDWVS